MIILQLVMAFVFYERHWETVTRRLTNAVAGDVSTLIWMMNTYNASDDRSLVFRIGRMHLDLEAYLHPDETLPDPLPPVSNARVERLLAQALQQRVQGQVGRITQQWHVPTGQRLQPQGRVGPGILVGKGASGGAGG